MAPRWRGAVAAHHPSGATCEVLCARIDRTRRRVYSSMNPPSLHRPEWLLSALLDGGVAGAAYLLAYWLRFRGGQLEAFLPSALSTMPLIVAGQLAALYVADA